MAENQTMEKVSMIEKELNEMCVNRNYKKREV